MNKKLVLVIGLFLLGGIGQSRGDGFIVVERPIYVLPTHFPFAPLEVTILRQHEAVGIDRDRILAAWADLVHRVVGA